MQEWVRRLLDASILLSTTCLQMPMQSYTQTRSQAPKILGTRSSQSIK